MCTTDGATAPSSGFSRHDRSNSYDAWPSEPSVACAVEVWPRACGSLASSTRSRASQSASTRPRSSSPQLVANRTGRSSRASATATLAALPPGNSVVLPSPPRTMSMRDSPTTSADSVGGAAMGHAYRIGDPGGEQ